MENQEAAAVAYCTKDTHGTRLIPPGALSAVQVRVGRRQNSFGRTDSGTKRWIVYEN
jgi:hypothetical protein